MKMRKLLAALLSAAMAAASAAIPVFADEVDEAAPAAVETETVEAPEEAAVELADGPTEEPTDEPEAVTDLQGEGTAENPYTINNDAEMEFFRHAINEKIPKYFGGSKDQKCFRLDADVTLTATETSGVVSDSSRKGTIADSGSIGQGYVPDCYFYGNFDGNSHSVTLVENGGTFKSGLINSPLGTISNLTVKTQEGQHISGSSGICGSLGNYAVIDNCVNEATIICADNIYVAGGIAGSTGLASVVKNCHNKGTITQTKTNVSNSYRVSMGGIVGRATSYTLIENCVNETGADISVAATCNYATGGGVAGSATGGITIKGCENHATITGTGTTDNYGYCNGTGGIIGAAAESPMNDPDSRGTIVDCTNTGAVTGKGRVGGIMGYGTGARNSIDGCVNEGTVTATEKMAGGILGHGANVKNCVNKGEVNAKDEVGGIAGKGTTIVKSYNEGIVKSTSGSSDTAGGVVGTTTNEGSLVMNYYYKAEGSDKDLKGIGGGTEASGGTHHDNPNHAQLIDNKPENEDALKKFMDGLAQYQVLTVHLEKNDTNDAVKVYLTGADGDIYRYMSGELVFKVSSSSREYVPMDYTVEAADNNIITELEGVSADGGTLRKFGFNLDGSHESSKTGERIELCTIKLLEYGQQYISVEDGVMQVAVNPGTDKDTDEDGILDGDDNIVSSLTPDNGLLVLPASPLNVNNKRPESALTFKVLFPNNVEKQSNNYTNMTITIDGAMLNNPYILEIGSLNSWLYKYGNHSSGEIISNGYKSPAQDGYNGYVLSSSKYLTVPTGGMYTITFSGDGYRTYSVDVYVDADKTITVWNNAMDDEHTVVETADKSVDTKVTFLAGDIDNSQKVDLYDLSAAVAYFGKSGMAKDNTTIKDNQEYIRYDLNRDGAIDSKDIAMVLVSWGN